MRSHHHGGELLGVLLQIDLELLGDVGGHRHRGVAAVAVVAEPLGDLLGADGLARGGQLARDPLEQRRLGGPGEISEGVPVDRHHHRHPVVDEHLAVAVEDPPSGRLDLDGPDPVGLGLQLIVGRADHLEVVQASEQRREQGHGDHGHHRQPQPRHLVAATATVDPGTVADGQAHGRSPTRPKAGATSRLRRRAGGDRWRFRRHSRRPTEAESPSSRLTSAPPRVGRARWDRAPSA